MGLWAHSRAIWPWMREACVPINNWVWKTMQQGCFYAALLYIQKKKLGICLLIKITSYFLLNKSDGLLSKYFCNLLDLPFKVIMPLNYLLGVIKSNKFWRHFTKWRNYKMPSALCNHLTRLIFGPFCFQINVDLMNHTCFSIFDGFLLSHFYFLLVWCLPIQK